MQKLPSHKGAEADQRFLYMSGVRSDDSGHLLVADARSRSLKVITADPRQNAGVSAPAVGSLLVARFR
ncbi:hypothetical protein OESDEN_09043 [Oesophagostomum dentatum]|uniref:Uncharacterized protein n=1 Tax=Oesophagostomum dentatum TaxID=61180 RepID=A0A0B1T1J0_OESDE|nr:hypothetical protein OESDEN_09043 [Oesophagostomum dentatum]